MRITDHTVGLRLTLRSNGVEAHPSHALRGASRAGDCLISGLNAAPAEGPGNAGSGSGGAAAPPTEGPVALSCPPAVWRVEAARTER